MVFSSWFRIAALALGVSTGGCAGDLPDPAPRGSRTRVVECTPEAPCEAGVGTDPATDPSSPGTIPSSSPPPAPDSRVSPGNTKDAHVPPGSKPKGKPSDGGVSAPGQDAFIAP